MNDVFCSDLVAESNVPVSQPTLIVVEARPVSDIPFASAGLNDPQMQVLRLLANGQTLTDAAHGSSVTRTTVYRWLGEHPAFAQVYQDVRRQLREVARADMQALVVEAMHNVRTAIIEGDRRLSLRLLKEMRIFDTEMPAQ